MKRCDMCKFWISRTDIGYCKHEGTEDIKCHDCCDRFVEIEEEIEEKKDKNLIPTIYTVACQYYHCSDSDDKQYPDCKEKSNRLVCPALKLIDLYEEIEDEKKRVA